MGQHYIPREYLGHFATASDPGKTWMYDKDEATFKNLPIAAVAQKSEFYLPKDEEALSQEVEGPAIAPLNALRQGKPISMEDRIKIATYMQFLLVRVPKHRRKIPSMLQDIAPEESKRLEQALRALGHESDEDYRLLDELKRGDFSSLAPEIVDALEKQLQLLPQTVYLLCSMPWRIFTTRTRQPFFTSDNPVCLLGGLENEDCEVIFPLSPRKALFASWAGEARSLLFQQAKAHQVRLVTKANRENADRFLFSHQPDKRILGAAARG